jgi:hypothetical protein
MIRFALIVCAVIGCARAETAETTTDPKVVPVPSVGVEIAGVTLADDCGEGPNTKALPPPAAGKATADSSERRSSGSAAHAPASDMPAAGSCAPGADCGGLPPRQCDQTSMQIAIKGNGLKTTIKVKRVELLDSSGKVVGTLTARKPMKWDGSAYVAWDEAITGDVSASYLLSAPDWNTLTKGRWNAANHRFQLRVTVTVGDKDRQIDKQSIVPVLPEPEVVT